MNRTVSLPSPAMTAVAEPKAAPESSRATDGFGDDTHVGGWLDAADEPCRDVGLGDADVVNGGADEPVQVADADRIAVKERVSSHAEVGQLLREVRAEGAEPDQDDARGCQPLLSRFTEQRDLGSIARPGVLRPRPEAYRCPRRGETARFSPGGPRRAQAAPSSCSGGPLLIWAGPGRCRRSGLAADLERGVQYRGPGRASRVHLIPDVKRILRRNPYPA